MPVARHPAVEVGIQRRKDAKAKVIMQLVKAKPYQKCSYKPDHKGWLGPVKTAPSRWAKARGAVIAFGFKGGRSRPTIDVASLVKATKKKHTTFSGRAGKRETPDTMTTHNPDLVPRENPEVLLREPSHIRKPFCRAADDTGEGVVWKTPAPSRHLSERSKQFSFDRPKPSERGNLIEAVGTHQAKYMKKILADKEREFLMLQRQLNKCNNDNVKLIQELEGFKGKNYTALSKENNILRTNNSRLLKENIILHGHVKKDGNSVLQNLSRKDALDAKHSRQPQNSKSQEH